MFGGMANKIGVLAKKATGGASDVTPNALDWSNITYNAALGGHKLTEKQITGINTGITLEATYAGSIGTLYVGVFSTQQNYEGVYVADLYVAGLNDFASGSTFSVGNNEWVVFGVSTFGESGEFDTVTVTNLSDSNTTLDTFIMSVP